MDEYGKRTKWWVGRDLTEAQAVHACVDSGDAIAVDLEELHEIENILEAVVKLAPGGGLGQRAARVLVLIADSLVESNRLFGEVGDGGGDAATHE